jgi:GNAT superfamily N-acetyltransferase
MLTYAESQLLGERRSGEKFIHANVNDFDDEFSDLVRRRGYQLKTEHRRPVYAYQISHPFPEICIPKGFQLKSLADDNDLRKIHRVLWRGFNHPGEPPEDGVEDRRKMQSTPNFRPDLTIVVEGLSGDFGSFCGLWYEPMNKLAYVEPVATDPDVRRLGLGRAAVLEGIRRCASEGAVVAYVGSDQQFYKALGFKKKFINNCWEKNF